jgi:hypothetical protein
VGVGFMSVVLSSSAEEYLDSLWKKYKSTIADISKSDDGSFGIDSDIEGWNFDKISDSFFPKQHAYSADGIFLRSKRICFVEFKSGFEKLINESNFNPSLTVCPKISGQPCEDYGELLKERDRYKNKELQENIQLKAVESFHTFKNLMCPSIDKQTENTTECLLVFYAVIDGENSENEIYEKIGADMGGVDVSDTNYFAKLKSCLIRFRKPDLWYDEIDVLSVGQFLNKFGA